MYHCSSTQPGAVRWQYGVTSVVRTGRLKRRESRTFAPSWSSAGHWLELAASTARRRNGSTRMSLGGDKHHGCHRPSRARRTLPGGGPVSSPRLHSAHAWSRVRAAVRFLAETTSSVGSAELRSGTPPRAPSVAARRSRGLPGYPSAVTITADADGTFWASSIVRVPNARWQLDLHPCLVCAAASCG